MEMALLRFLRAFSYRKNPTNQNSESSSVTISMYFCSTLFTFWLSLTSFILPIGIKTCIHDKKHIHIRIQKNAVGEKHIHKIPNCSCSYNLVSP